jgi:hypothetical protein
LDDPPSEGPLPGGLVLAPVVPGDVREVTYRVLALLQRWLSVEGDRLVLVTRGALGDVPDPVSAAVWGLVRSAQAEAPGRFVLLDLDGDAGSLAAVPAALAAGEPQVAIRGGELLVPRLSALPAPAAVPTADASGQSAGDEAPDPAYDGAGTYLVTGANGSLGSLIARHLVAVHGVRHLLLTGRRGVDPALVAELTDLGAHVVSVTADMADRSAVAAALASVPAEHPLRGVVHSAGVLDDGVLGSLTPERLDAVLRPKADAATHLDELTRGLGLRMFVLFSSLAGTFGTPGQANYAAANAFLDALAARRRAGGETAVSLAWGPWERTGMAGTLSDADRARIARAGVVPFTAEDGLALFDRALGSDRPAVVPVRLNLPAVQAGSPNVPAVLRGLVRPPVRRSAGHASGTAGAAGAADAGERLRKRLLEVPDARQRELLVELVGTVTAAVLGHSGASAVDPERGFLDMGVDSLTAVELRDRLREATGVALASTVVFDHPTAAALSAHLHDELALGPAAADDLVLADLERVAASFGSVSDDGRAALTARLQQLLSLVGHQPGGDTDVASQIDGASDDEVFAFIDNELGIS